MAGPDVVTRFTTGLAVSCGLHRTSRGGLLETLPRVVTLLTACGAAVGLAGSRRDYGERAGRDTCCRAGLLVVAGELADGATAHRVNRVRSTDSIV
jgi:hypothetical protein